MPIVVEIPNRGSIEFDDGASDADIDAIVSKEFPPTPDDSYNKVLQFQGAQIDYTPSKQEFLDYLKVSKTKPLLGEKPLETIGTAAVQTVEDIASMPYKLGEAIGQYMDPPEGVTPMQLAGGTAAEIAVQSRLKAENMGRGLIDTALNKLSDITGKLRNDDDKYEAFLAAAEIKRQLARANAPGDQRVPASQDVLQAYGIPEEAISQQGLDVGGFLADPSSIAFAGGGKLASALAQRAIPLIPRAGQVLQRAGERISNLGRVPENMAGRFTAGVTGSEQMGQAVQEGIAKGTTGITLGEAAGLPITMNVPGLGTIAKTITATKGLGGAMETAGEAGAVSGGPSLTATQRGLLGAGESIAAAEGASSRARALGTALARSGLETPVRGAATILLPMVGAGAAGGALAALTGEEGDAVAAAIGSGAGFGVFDGGFTLAKAVQANAFNGARVRQTAVDDLNTRPTEVQFTYIDPVAGEQTAIIKDSEARATLYGRLNNKQLTKALSEVAAAEGAGVDVIFHSDADTVPAGLQTVNYAGAAIGPKDIKSGRPTILINVDKAIPETIPHEILHARITQDMVSQLGAKAIDAASADPNFQRQFTDFANKYADKLQSAGGSVVADRIRTELRDAFDPAQQRAQKIESLKRITDEFAAYYTQEMLKGKDPKTMLPGRIPSFFEMALNNAKEAVSERFTRRALQAGFDPVARTFYDANGRRIKLDWMEDAIKNLVNPKEGYEPTEQKVDINKMTQAQQNAVIMARGYSDLFMTAPDGSIVRPLSKAELIARTADIANRTMQVVESVPQAERTSISGMDAYGNPVIEGRLSLAEADAVSKSGIFGPSSSRTLIDIATAIRNGTLMEGNYWKVYGSTGKSGVFGESQKLFLPYGISINSKGGVNVKVVDWGKVQARMYKALSKPAYKSLFNNYDQAMSTMRDVYLKNIAETGAVPSAEALGGGIEGAKKRNMFNEIMGAVPRKGDVMVNFPTAGYVANRRGGSVYQDLRLERIQNADTTSAQIPWTGDMGEQSSYRRTQLNFMPAEAIGETKVSTDDNAGYRILSKNGKFRLYGPDGSTVGIFDTQEQAKLKAEKDYATQERLQPEVRQQQRPLGDEGRQATEAGGRNRAVGGQEGQGQGGAVRQAGDVVIAPDAESFTIPKADMGRFMPASDKVRLEDYADRKIIALAADRMGIGQMTVGPKGAKRDLSVLGQGGRGFMNIFNGGGWAFSDQSTADRFISRLKKDADPNGNVIVGITVQSPINHLKNQTGQLAYIEAMQAAIDSKTITKRAADSQIAAMSSAIVNSTAKSIKQSARDKFSKINSLADLNNAVQNKQLNFADMEPLLTQMQRKALPITAKELAAAGISPADIARDIADPELADVPFGSVVALLGVNVKQAPEKTGFHYSYPWTIHGETIGYLDKFYNISDLTTEQRIRNKAGTVTAQPLQTVMPVMDNIINTIKTKQGIPSDPSMRFMPSSLTARDINAIADEVGGGDVKGGAKAFGAFMRSMRDKGITLRDVVKSYGITLSSIQRQELAVSTIKKNWPDAPFAEGTKVRPEDAFAQLLGTPEGQKYLDAAESGVFDEQAADAVVQKFRSFGFHNKLKEQMKTAVEQFYPKAKEIIDAVNSMPTDQFIDYVRNNVKGISYGKVGFWSGQLGRGDIPTFDSRQGKLVYGKEVPVTKQVLMDQKDRLTQLGIKVPAAFKDFAQTLLHHEVWDRLNQSDTEHGPIKEAMLRYMPSDTDYLSAVKQGDTKAAQQMVDEAAKAAGYTTKVFHGSISQFNKPNTPLFLGDEGTAMSYAQDRAMAYGEGANPVTYKIYAKFKNTASESDVKQAAMDLGLEVENDMAYTALDPQISGSKYVSRVISELKKRGYDSANIDDFSPDSAQNVIKSFVAFDPSQLKRSDPITKDDAGNVIPLSQRFKATSEDIRYMPAGDMATGRSVKDHREAMDLFEKGYRLYGALYDGMEDPIRLKKASEIERFDPENLWAVPSKKIAAAIGIRNMPADIKRDIGRNLDFANPPTDSEAVDALSSEKKAKFGAARSIKPGTQVAARIDIPAFLRTGKYVVAVHEPDGEAGGPGKVIGYDTVTRLQNPKFVVKPGVQRIYEGKSAKFPVATVDGKIMADRSIPSDLENYVPVGMDPKEHAYFYDKRTDQPVISGSEAVSVGNTVFVKNPVYGKPEDFRFMPSPDSAMPGAYSFPGGYRALPGKAKGSLRLYGPAGSLIGIASSLDEAQRILRRKGNR